MLGDKYETTNQSWIQPPPPPPKNKGGKVKKIEFFTKFLDVRAKERSSLINLENTSISLPPQKTSIAKILDTYEQKKSLIRF